MTTWLEEYKYKFVLWLWMMRKLNGSRKTYMGRFSQERNFDWFVSLKKRICWLIPYIWFIWTFSRDRNIWFICTFAWDQNILYLIYMNICAGPEHLIYMNIFLWPSYLKSYLYEHFYGTRISDIWFIKTIAWDGDIWLIQTFAWDGNIWFVWTFVQDQDIWYLIYKNICLGRRYLIYMIICARPGYLISELYKHLPGTAISAIWIIQTFPWDGDIWYLIYTNICLGRWCTMQLSPTKPWAITWWSEYNDNIIPSAGNIIPDQQTIVVSGPHFLGWPGQRAVWLLSWGLYLGKY